MSDRWPHQIRSHAAVTDAIARDVRRVLVTTPTGGGKTMNVVDLIEWAAAPKRDWRVAVYVNRRMLARQTSGVFADFGLEHGVRAAGARDRRELPVQVCSIQTEGARVLRREGYRAWDVHDAQLAVFDEAHLHAGDESVAIAARHLEAGAFVVGYTATPIGLGHLYDELVVAGTNGELRDCGSLVPCKHYAPEEPDLRLIGRVAVGEDPTENQNRRAMGGVGKDGKADVRLYRLFGRVIDQWRAMNPDGRPTVLFAPGVAESVWFAQELARNGVPAAHIDGEKVWANGESTPTSESVREQVLDDHRDGRIKILCNRFVLREGLDLKWAEVGLLCTIFGSLQSFIQAGGRLLRACPDTGKAEALVIDFGGNYWRHGSLNADREWHLDCTAASVVGVREERLRDKLEREPYPCPKCNRVLTTRICPGCGFDTSTWAKARPVIQVDGSLVMIEGDVFEPREVAPKAAHDWQKDWTGCYFRCKNAKSKPNFRKAFGLFAMDHYGKYPNPDWKFFPLDYWDHFRPVADVPPERLR